MKSKRFFSLLTTLFIIVITAACLVSGIILLLSVFRSGYGYQFDRDELYYIQHAFLYMRGFRPYLDVYITNHPAVFQWILIPVFWVNGFTVDTLYGGRILMIVFLIIRLFFAWLTLRMIFSKRTAFLFLFLFLFDPFAVLTTMQIRPDNLMLMLYTVGLFFFTLAMTRSKKFIPVAGLFLGGAFIVFPKIAPSVAVLGTGFLVYCLYKRKIKDVIILIFYGMIPAFLYCLYLLYAGSFAEMIIQTFKESALFYTSYTNQVPINSLFKPDNIWVFGTMGKPITWVYLWLIIPVGLTGVYHAFHTIIEKGEPTTKDVIKILLGITFLVQWGLLFALQVAFMQHYMPLDWLGAVFSAYAIDELLTASKHHRILYPVLTIFFIIAFGWLTKASIDYNNARSTISDKPALTAIETRWKQIPPNQAVFPGYLFRPSVYPITYAAFIGDYPTAIIDRLPGIPGTLETTHPMVLLDDYTLDHLPTDAAVYIRDNYTRVPGDNELMTRNK